MILVAVGGLSGAGKSVLAHALADRLGARLLRTDLIRKQHDRTPAYTPHARAAIYAELARQVRQALAAGRSVVADATFADPAHRQALTDTAAASGARFHGLWLDAPLALRLERIAARTDDPSDATPETLPRQPDPGTPPGWTRLDAALAPEATLAAALRGTL